MENEWLDLAWVNFTKVILHGHINEGIGERTIEQVLTDEQRETVYDLKERHAAELKRLLRGFVT